MEPFVTLYIAFSINGTNAFITATKQVGQSKLAQTLADLYKDGFKSEPSRRPGFNSSKEHKLHWKGLCTKAGAPLRSPAIVVQRFRQLSEQGWTTDKSRFVAKHWPKKAEV